MTPYRQRVVVGDEAKRLGTGAVEPARQQHAERLMGEPSFERIGDQKVPAAARKRFDKHVIGSRDDRALRLKVEPIRDRQRQAGPGTRIGEHRPDARRKMRRHRELAAIVARDHRIFRRGARDEDFGVAQRFEAQHLAGENERRTRRQLFDETFRDFAQDAPALPCAAFAAARRDEPDFHIGVSTMVPTFKRYCWAMRGLATRNRPSPAGFSFANRS